MTSAVTCLKRAGIDDDTAAEINRIADFYRGEGLDVRAAFQKAADEIFDSTLGERESLSELVESKGGVIPDYKMETTNDQRNEDK